MLQAHITFSFSSGGILAEDEWSFSAIDISKAILKLKFENAGSSISPHYLLAEYYETATMTWRELGKIEQHWTGTRYSPDEYGEFDVTEICRANPRFKWRISVGGPWILYYSSMKAYATLHLEYAGTEPSATSRTAETIFGGELSAMAAQMMSLMINFMMMFMIMSMIMSFTTSIAEET
jgi:hypothetical protein